MSGLKKKQKTILSRIVGYLARGAESRVFFSSRYSNGKRSRKQVLRTQSTWIWTWLIIVF